MMYGLHSFILSYLDVAALKFDYNMSTSENIKTFRKQALESSLKSTIKSSRFTNNRQKP